MTENAAGTETLLWPLSKLFAGFIIRSSSSLSAHLHLFVLLPAVHSLLAGQRAVLRVVVLRLRHPLSWRPPGALPVRPQGLGAHAGLLPHQGESWPPGPGFNP